MLVSSRPTLSVHIWGCLGVLSCATSVELFSEPSAATVDSGHDDVRVPSDAVSEDVVGFAEAGPDACEEPCRLILPQCGCEDGLACQSLGGGARECGTPGRRGVGETCLGNPDCQAGMSCVGFLGATGRCLLYCAEDMQCSGTSCVWFAEGIGICLLPSCDPVNQQGCSEGMACYLAKAINARDGAWITYASCADPGTQPEGASCPTTGELVCEPGTGCINGTCQSHCIVGSPCADGRSCAAINPRGVVGAVEYGICVS